MIVGVPAEIKPDEYRVAITPAGVREMAEHGHLVLIEAGAGEGSAISDSEFESQGARIVPDAATVFTEAGMILKVKEPQPAEIELLRRGQLLFTYLHLAPDPEQTRGLRDSGATCIAYETVEDARGRLPLLAPMSEIAGRLASQAGAYFLEKPLGGRGLLLGGAYSSSTTRSTACASWRSPSPGVARPSTRPPSRWRRCCPAPTW